MNIQLSDLKADIERSVKQALHEDIKEQDITALLIPEQQNAQATIITREPCTLCGQAWVEEVFLQVGAVEKIIWHAKDGDKLEANEKIATIKGNTRSLLTGERTALNFLQLLSATATKSAEYANQTQGNLIKILDTRKTIPGLRTAQKYAVTVGGCDNHRIGLYDAFLIKENHIAACEGIANAINSARSLNLDKPIIIEVENTSEYQQAMAAKADVIMLDNFPEDELKSILNSHNDENIHCEITGNVSLENLKKIDTIKAVRVSVGDITKNIQAIDLSFRLEN